METLMQVEKVAGTSYATNLYKDGRKQGWIKFEPKEYTIQEYIDMYSIIDCQPIGQRLPVSDLPFKKEGIIRTIWSGYSIGQITICKNKEGSKYNFESIDGGHRKRYIWQYVQNKFQVDGMYFKDHSPDEQNAFKNDYKLYFVVYENLDIYSRGEIFRNLNETTDVVHQEMCNSYGNIFIANLIRDNVRIVPQVGNTPHTLFQFRPSVSTDQINKPYYYLEFDNKRLKTEAQVARICYRLTQKTYLGSSSEDDVNNMYHENKFKEKELTNKLKSHLDFLQQCAVAKKQTNTDGLTQQDFKLLSFLRYYLLDNYGRFKINDIVEFMKSYRRAFLTIKTGDIGNSKLKQGYRTPVKDIPELKDSRDSAISEIFIKYINAPDNEKKITQALDWLLAEFNVLEHLIIQDASRGFNKEQKEIQLDKQGFVCYIDGLTAHMNECEAAHITADADGGLCIPSNMKMVRKCHNQAMGTMNLYTYKKDWDEKNSVSV